MFYIIFLRLIATSLFGNGDAKKKRNVWREKKWPFFFIRGPNSYRSSTEWTRGFFCWNCNFFFGLWVFAFAVISRARPKNRKRHPKKKRHSERPLDTVWRSQSKDSSQRPFILIRPVVFLFFLSLSNFDRISCTHQRNTDGNKEAPARVIVVSQRMIGVDFIDQHSIGSWSNDGHYEIRSKNGWCAISPHTPGVSIGSSRLDFNGSHFWPTSPKKKRTKNSAHFFLSWLLVSSSTWIDL